MLQLDFINVGYGDAILVREDGVFSMLIDCGSPTTDARDPASPRITAADFLREAGVTRLDLLVLTHLHIDHIGTFAEIAAQVEVGAFWTPYLPARKLWRADDATLRPLQHGMREFLAGLCALQSQNTAMRAIETPETVRLTGALAAEIDFSYRYLPLRQRRTLDDALSGRPDRHEVTLWRRYMNAAGPILTLCYHGKRAVLPADVVGHLWHARPLPPCHVLKAPHHGCEYSVTERLLGALRPDIIVVSASSDRKHDRPDPESVALMRRHAGQVRFTDAVRLGAFAGPAHRCVTVTIP